jgi:uncharacterized sulfatase
MTRRHASLLVLAAAVILLFAPAVLSAAAETSRPNIVLMFGDDLTWHDVGPYGGYGARTPNIDRLATESLKFNRAYSASPTCTPSRSAMFTGLYPVRNGAHANHSLVKEGVRSLPQYLKDLGYRVVIAGKTHFGPREQFPFEYLEGSNVMPPGKREVLWTDLGVEAIDKLLATHDKAQPLCLIVAAHSPHTTWPEVDGYDAKQLKLPPYFVDTPRTRQARARYLTDVTQLDREVGKVDASLAKHGYADSTMFLFTSDQGAQFPFGKWNLYDAGIKVPLLVRWPGKTKPASTTDAMVSLIDLLPTFIEAAGAAPPADLDGRSFLGVLTGKTDVAREEIYASHTGDKAMNQAPMRAIRRGKWKYIVNLRPDLLYTTHVTKAPGPDGYWGSWVNRAKTDPKAAVLVDRYEHRKPEEVYDLESDPFELNNVANDPAHAATLAELREKVKQWRVQQGEDLSKPPLMPVDVRPGQGPKYAG